MDFKRGFLNTKKGTKALRVERDVQAGTAELPTTVGTLVRDGSLASSGLSDSVGKETVPTKLDKSPDATSLTEVPTVPGSSTISNTADPGIDVNSDIYLINAVYDQSAPSLTEEERRIFIPFFEKLIPQTNFDKVWDYNESLSRFREGFLETRESLGNPRETYRVYHRDSKDPAKPPFIWAGFEYMLPTLEQKICDAPLPIVSPPAHRLGESSIPGAGKGMFATRDIKAFETILIERPIFIYTPINSSALEALEEIQNVPGNLRDQFWSLTNAFSTDLMSHENGILNTNQFAFRSPVFGELGCFSVLPLQIARCNHNCSPNAAAAGVGDKLWFELRATRDIAKDEEICISYKSVLEKREVRHNSLKNYQFICTCKYCTLPSRLQMISDENRRLVNEQENLPIGFYHFLFFYDSESPGNTDLAQLLKIEGKALKAAQDEGLHKSEFFFALWITLAYAVLGHRKNFIEWAKRTQRSMRLQSTPTVGFRTGEEWDEWIAKPETIPVWNMKRNRRHFLKRNGGSGKALHGPAW